MSKIINLGKLSTYSYTKINESTTNWVTENTTLFDVWLPTSITSKLIQLAAKWTNRCTSDLIYSIDDMRREISTKINEKKGEINHVEYFGFRKDGVDHESFIKCRSPEEYNYTYCEVWKLEVYQVKEVPNQFNWSLAQLTDYIFDKDLIEEKK